MNGIRCYLENGYVTLFKFNKYLMNTYFSGGRNPEIIMFFQEIDACIISVWNYFHRRNFNNRVGM